MPNSRKLLIFDLDGTLVDSNLDLIPALNAATQTCGLPPLSREDVGFVVGSGALAMIEKSFALNNRPLERGGSEHRRLLDLFLLHYEAHIADNTVFFPGVLDALDRLRDDGWELAVCTNKYEHLARQLLSELGQIQRFVAITGGDTFPQKKPDPSHLLKTAELAGVNPANCIMVGDSVNDIAPAKAAGIPVIAVDFGYTDIPVNELGPDLIISHFDQLFGAVSQLLRKPA